MQTPVLIGFGVLVGYMLNRWAERRISARNYAVLKSAGGEELASRLIRKYYLVSALIFPAAVLESLVLDPLVWREMILIGLGLVIFGHAIRYWAIGSLGSLWSMHCVGLPGVRPVNAGPYRFFNNPEYMSRVMDGVGIALITGARFSGLAFLIASYMITRRLANLEQRQLSELGGVLTKKYQTMS